MNFMAITLSNQEGLFLVGAVVSGLVGAVGVLYRGKEEQAKEWRADSERLFTVVHSQADTLDLFRTAFNQMATANEQLASRIARCPHVGGDV